jgi:hypothetical protein
VAIRLSGSREFSVDYFSVAKEAVLIGVNPCLNEFELKKQSQFAQGKMNISLYMKKIMKNSALWKKLKNKANLIRIAYRVLRAEFCGNEFEKTSLS